MVRYGIARRADDATVTIQKRPILMKSERFYVSCSLHPRIYAQAVGRSALGIDAGPKTAASHSN
jgi:hypothetical protein